MVSAPCVLVTGGSGFTGRHLVQKLLMEGLSVILLSRQKTHALPEGCREEIYDGSYASFDAVFQKQKVEAVFHLAGHSCQEYSLGDIEKMLEANVRFGLLLLEAMYAHSCYKLIYAGSFFQYSSNDSFGYDPSCLYAATKQAFTNIVTYYVTHKNFKTIHLILTDSYGPNDTRKKIVNLLMDHFYQNKPLRMSAGEQEISLVYISDVVNAFFQAYLILQEAPQRFEKSYYVSAPPIKLKTLTAIIASLMNKDREEGVLLGALPYRPGEIMQIFSGPTLPNWTPQVNLIDGLKEIISKKIGK